MSVSIERAMITAQRVDDFAERRYLITLTVTIPAETVTDAIHTALDALRELTP